MAIGNIEKLATLGALANATLELDKLLELVIDAISRLVNSEGGSVLLLEEDELIFVVATGQKGGNLKRLRLPRGNSIAWSVIESGVSCVCNDPENDEQFSGTTDKLIGFRTRNLIAVPIRVEKKVLGVLEAVNKRRGKFSDSDRRILEAFADLVAVAIRNAQIFGKLHRLQNQQISEFEAEYQLIGVSHTIDRLREIIKKIAPTPSTVLITGESGVGKEVVARQIHIMSERIMGPFIKVACPSFPETILESELFGYEKETNTGAIQKKTGRFEAARGGTILLDEIGELPMTVQAKLLRILHEGVFERLGSNESIRTDARIIATTNHDLKEEIESGTFRQDLFFRLSVLPIDIPPLRERPEDIPPLVEYLILKLRRKFPHSTKGISVDALAVFLKHDWCGNVRELENIIERIIVMFSPEIINIEHFPNELTERVSEKPYKGTLPDIERRAIESALAQTHGNQSEAADILGITRDKLRYRIERYCINPKEFKVKK